MVGLLHIVYSTSTVSGLYKKIKSISVHLNGCTYMIIKNSNDRGLRSSPDLDPDLG